MEKSSPSLILAVAPKEKIKIPDDFYSKNSIFYTTIQSPPSLRRYGWDLSTHDTPRLKDGVYWEVGIGNVKIMRLYADGSFVVSALISKDFLAWGSKDDDNKLHALAAVEFIYIFTELYRIIIKNIAELGIQVGALNFKIGIIDLKTIGGELSTKPYEANTYGSMFDGIGEKYYIENDFNRDVEQNLFGQDYDSRYVAYNLAVVLFRQFGVTSEVPYARVDDAGKKFIDIEKIKAIQ